MGYVTTPELYSSVEGGIAHIGVITVGKDHTVASATELVHQWFGCDNIHGMALGHLFPGLPQAVWSSKEADTTLSTILDDEKNPLRDVILEFKAGPSEEVPLTVSIGERTALVDASTTLDTHLKVVSRIVTQLSHDLNNPLMGIMAALDTTLEFENLSTEASRMIGGAREELLRVAQIVRRTRDQARGHSTVIESISIFDVIAAVLEPMRTDLERHDLTLTILGETAVGQFRSDPIELKSIVMNLVLNARDATAKYGNTIRVRVHRIVEPPGDWVRIDVQDDGCGMNSEALRQAGTLFYTTKEHGSGVGLAAVRRGVAALGGAVLLRSVFGKGTQASVLLREAPASLHGYRPSLF